MNLSVTPLVALLLRLLVQPPQSYPGPTPILYGPVLLGVLKFRGVLGAPTVFDTPIKKFEHFSLGCKNKM